MKSKNISLILITILILCSLAIFVNAAEFEETPITIRMDNEGSYGNTETYSWKEVQPGLWTWIDEGGVRIDTQSGIPGFGKDWSTKSKGIQTILEHANTEPPFGTYDLDLWVDYNGDGTYDTGRIDAWEFDYTKTVEPVTTTFESTPISIQIDDFGAANSDYTWDGKKWTIDRDGSENKAFPVDLTGKKWKTKSTGIQELLNQEATDKFKNDNIKVDYNNDGTYTDWMDPGEFDLSKAILGGSIATPTSTTTPTKKYTLEIQGIGTQPFNTLQEREAAYNQLLTQGIPASQITRAETTQAIVAADAIKFTEIKLGNKVVGYTVFADGVAKIYKPDEKADAQIYYDQKIESTLNKWATQNSLKVEENNVKDKDGNPVVYSGTGKDREYYSVDVSGLETGDTLKKGSQITGTLTTTNGKIGSVTGIPMSYSIDSNKDLIPTKIGDLIVDQYIFDQLKQAANPKGSTITQIGDVKSGSITVKDKNSQTQLSVDFNLESANNRIYSKTINSNYIEGIPLNTEERVYKGKSLTEKTLIDRTPLYLDTNGNQITAHQFSLLEESERDLKAVESKIVAYAGYNSKGENPETAVILERTSATVMEETHYTYKFDSKENLKSSKVDWQSYKYLEDTNKDGDLDTIVTFKDGKTDQITELNGNPKTLTQKQTDALKSKARKAYSRTRVTNWIQNADYYSTVFRGLGGYTSILPKNSRDALDEWAESVDGFFCSTVLFGGKDCWVSEICKHTYDKSSDSVTYVETPDGMIEPGAHVEGERSEEIEQPGEDEYFYKFTFYVKSSEKDVNFNVVIYRDNNKKRKLFDDSIKLRGNESGKGDSYSATNEYAIVGYSEDKYKKICIIFEEPGDIEVDRLCNKIEEADYSKDNYLDTDESDGNTQTGESGEDEYEESQNQKPNKF